MDLRQIYTEDVFGPSLGPAGMSLNVKVRGQRSRSPGQKRAVKVKITEHLTVAHNCTILSLSPLPLSRGAQN